MKILCMLAGYGSVWLERTAGGREVAGSNPVIPTFCFVRRSSPFTLQNGCFRMLAGRLLWQGI